MLLWLLTYYGLCLIWCSEILHSTLEHEHVSGRKWQDARATKTVFCWKIHGQSLEVREIFTYFFLKKNMHYTRKEMGLFRQ